MRPSTPIRVALASSFVVTTLACGEQAPATTAPTTSATECPAPHLDVPTTPGYPSAAVVETHARVLVQTDVDPLACLVSLTARRESSLVTLTFEGVTYRARLAAEVGTTRESLTSHVATQRLLHTLLDAGATSAVSNGRGVALGLGDHAAVCYRSVATDPSCVRAPAVTAFDSIAEPSLRQLVVRSIGSDGASEWEVASGAEASFTTRHAALDGGRALGEPPPDPDRFASVRSAAAEPFVAAADTAAMPTANAMPTGAATVRLETRAVGASTVAVLSRCEGLLPHCVTAFAVRSGDAWRFAPSFATDPARIDAVEDAAALGPGALLVRLLVTGFHEGSARDVFLVPESDVLAVYDVTLGTETERGEGEAVTEGCYRSLTIEGANRVRLAGAHGWSGTHGARGWNVVPSTTCAPDAALCLEASVGFGPCH